MVCVAGNLAAACLCGRPDVPERPGRCELPNLWLIMFFADEHRHMLGPSCTARVCPSMAGTIIDRFDQVLMTFLVPVSFCLSTFFIRWSSTNGALFQAAWHELSLLSGLTAANNELSFALVLRPSAAFWLSILG